jgi:hypothetical protein
MVSLFDVRPGRVVVAVANPGIWQGVPGESLCRCGPEACRGGDGLPHY